MSDSAFVNVLFIAQVSTDSSAAIMGNGFSYVKTSNNIFVDCTIPFKLNDWFLESWGAPNYATYLAAWHTQFNQTKVRLIPLALPVYVLDVVLMSMFVFSFSGCRINRYFLRTVRSSQAAKQVLSNCLLSFVDSSVCVRVQVP